MSKLLRVNHNYFQACRYCYWLQPSQPKDLVHDVYLWYYDKTNQNLFDLPNEEMIKIIRNKWRSLQFRKMIMIDGVRHFKQFVEISLDYEPSTWTPKTAITPEDILIGRELSSRIDNLPLTVKEGRILEKLKEGYLVGEISTIFGENLAPVKYQTLKLRKKVKQVL